MLKKTTKSKTPVKTKKNTRTGNRSKNEDLSYMKDDKLLEEVEKYVDKNRESTSQKIIERKANRPSRNYQEADLEVMISRIKNESQSKEKTKEVSKWILYLIYVIVIIAILIFIVKYFFVWNILPQIS